MKFLPQEEAPAKPARGERPDDAEPPPAPTAPPPRSAFGLAPSVAFGDTSPVGLGLAPSVAFGDTSPNGSLRSLGEETARFARWGRKRLASLAGGGNGSLRSLGEETARFARWRRKRV